MPINWKANKMREIARKRMEEKKAVKAHWRDSGGFSKMEDKLKEKYRRDIDAGNLPF